MCSHVLSVSITRYIHVVHNNLLTLQCDRIGYISYPDDSKEIAHCFVGRESANAVTILQQPGVINWNITNRLRKGTVDSITTHVLL